MTGRTCKQHSHAEPLAQHDAVEGAAHLYPRYPEVNLGSTCVPEDLKRMGALPKTALSGCGTTLPILELEGKPLEYTYNTYKEAPFQICLTGRFLSCKHLEDFLHYRLGRRRLSPASRQTCLAQPKGSYSALTTHELEGERMSHVTCVPEDLKCIRALPRPAFSSCGAMSPILDPAGRPLTYRRCSLGGVGSSSQSVAYGTSDCIRLILPRLSCTSAQLLKRSL